MKLSFNFYRDLIRQAVNALEKDVVIFTSSGCTGAVHKLIHALNLKSQPVIMCLNLSMKSRSNLLK